jgi:hypothetical protein
VNAGSTEYRLGKIQEEVWEILLLTRNMLQATSGPEEDGQRRNR